METLITPTGVYESGGRRNPLAPRAGAEYPPPGSYNRSDVPRRWRARRKPGQKKEDYPPGFFDDKVEEMFQGPFVKHFKESFLPSYTPFEGNGDLFLTFWMKFHKHVHTRPAIQVHPEIKLTLLTTLLKPESPAHQCVLPFTIYLDKEEGYNLAVKALWDQFNKNMEPVKDRFQEELLHLIPESDSPNHLMSYINRMKFIYVSLTNCAMSKEEAGKMVMKQITKTLNQTIICNFLMSNGLPLHEKLIWFTKGKVEDNLWHYCSSLLVSIQALAEEGHEKDEASTFKVNQGFRTTQERRQDSRRSDNGLAHRRTNFPQRRIQQSTTVHFTGNGSNQEDGGEFEELDRWAREEETEAIFIINTDGTCIFLDGQHSVWDCKLPSKMRFNIMKDLHRCFNCFGFNCGRICKKVMHCNYCKDTDKPKHHRTLCLDKTNPTYVPLTTVKEENQQEKRRNAVKREYNTTNENGSKKARTTTNIHNVNTATVHKVSTPSATEGMKTEAQEGSCDQWSKQFEEGIEAEIKNQGNGNPGSA